MMGAETGVGSVPQDIMLVDEDIGVLRSDMDVFGVNGVRLRGDSLMRAALSPSLPERKWECDCWGRS